MVRIISIILYLLPCLWGAHAYAQPAPKNETVVLLHGIAMTKNSMKSVEESLINEGYNVLNITYPSQKKDLKSIADFLSSDHLTKEFWNKSTHVHFVTHSMGGLVTRTYLDTYKNEIPREKLGRVVMMGPPNKGSEVADLIHKLPPYEWYYGPAGQELTTQAREINTTKPYYDLGIIAGTKEWPYFVAAFVTPGKSDGRVTVENTKLEGMKDHIALSATHTFIMKKDSVHKQIIHFLKNGAFIHDK